MQIKHIALASLALIASVQAQAETKITGASASALGYIEALNSVCSTKNVKVYTSSGASGSLGNNFTITCDVNFTGTTEKEVQFDVSGGSLNAIMFSDSVQAGENTTLIGNGKFVRTASATGTNACTPTVATGTLAFLNFKDSNTANTAASNAATKLMVCATTFPTTTAKSIGGFMDVEPSIFLDGGVLVNDYSADVVPATFSQAFAVGVSSALYSALQTKQIAEGLIPATCTSSNATPLCQPTIGKAQLTAMISSADVNDAKNKGPKFLVPGTTQTDLTYCRRPATSGTQQGAEVYFLRSSGYLIHDPSIIDNVTVFNNTRVTVDNLTGNTFTIQMNSGTSDVKKCLNGSTLPAGKTMSFGFLSAENNPVAGTDTYRLVRLQGMPVSEGTASASQTFTAVNGGYDYVFESVMFDPHANAVLAAINNNVKTGALTPGVFLNINSATPESNFTRNGDSNKAVTSN